MVKHRVIQLPTFDYSYLFVMIVCVCGEGNESKLWLRCSAKQHLSTLAEHLILCLKMNYANKFHACVRCDIVLPSECKDCGVYILLVLDLPNELLIFVGPSHS